ncbi:MAG: Flp family type IVb pilin [Deltaproteobacteria bacterium]|nr:Flp family type IVb pilin [Deltaproteobacteria bacterium]
MREMLKRFLREDDGASMAEYAILLAVITGALVIILGLYTNSMGNIFNFVREKLDEAHQAASS